MQCCKEWSQCSINKNKFRESEASVISPKNPCSNFIRRWNFLTQALEATLQCLFSRAQELLMAVGNRSKFNNMQLLNDLANFYENQTLCFCIMDSFGAKSGLVIMKNNKPCGWIYNELGLLEVPHAIYYWKHFKTINSKYNLIMLDRFLLA